MWNLLRAELRYNAVHILPLALFVPVILVYELWRPEEQTSGFLMLLISFLMVNNIISFRAQEKRDRLYALMPFSTQQLATARALMIVVPTLLIFAFYVILNLMINPAPMVDYRNLMILAGLVFLGLSVFIVVRDASFFSPRLSRYLNLQKLLLVLVAGLTVSAVLASLAAWQAAATRSGGEQPLTLRIVGTLFEFVETHNPFDGLHGNIALFLLSLVFLSLTVVTFRVRKSYLE